LILVRPELKIDTIQVEIAAVEEGLAVAAGERGTILLGRL